MAVPLLTMSPVPLVGAPKHDDERRPPVGVVERGVELESLSPSAWPPARTRDASPVSRRRSGCRATRLGRAAGRRGRRSRARRRTRGRCRSPQQRRGGSRRCGPVRAQAGPTQPDHERRAADEGHCDEPIADQRAARCARMDPPPHGDDDRTTHAASSSQARAGSWCRYPSRGRARPRTASTRTPASGRRATPRPDAVAEQARDDERDDEIERDRAEPTTTSGMATRTARPRPSTRSARTRRARSLPCGPRGTRPRAAKGCGAGSWS